MKLRRLSNHEFELAEKFALLGGIPLDVCPTCKSKEVVVQHEDSGDYVGRVNGTYRYLGEEHECDCDAQISLRKHYLVAAIPEQYQRLNWNDYQRSEEVRERVNDYIWAYEWYRASGMGLEFGGPDLATGKTFAATHLGKELIKLGHKAKFIHFREFIGLFVNEEKRELENELRDTEVVILDEVMEPTSSVKQQVLFAERFEMFIRYRTNWNLPTIMTTNLASDALYEHYPRVVSLLEPKQVKVPMSGEDFRMSVVANENLEIVKNRETRPIT